MTALAVDPRPASQLAALLTDPDRERWNHGAYEPTDADRAAGRRRKAEHIDVGIMLMRKRAYAAALDEFRAGFRLDPTDHRLLVNAACAYQGMKQYDLAEGILDEALRLAPECAEAYENLGVVLRLRGDSPEGSIAAIRTALALQGRDPRSRTAINLANSYEAAGQSPQALAVLNRALKRDPENVELRVSRGLNRLAAGELAGMTDLDYRLRRSGHSAALIPGVPLWDGSDLGEKTLIVNQYVDGFGDAIQGIRSAPAARKKCGRLVVAADAAIRRLLERAPGVDGAITTVEECQALLETGQVAAQTPALALPWLAEGVGAGEPIRAPIPYLSPDMPDVLIFRKLFAAHASWTIGILWQGDPRHSNDCRRSFRLEHLVPLAKVPGVQLVSLQKGQGTDQLREVPFAVYDACRFRHYDRGDMRTTAAAIAACHLVIAPDTGLAHLAGALGKPVWIGLPFEPEWRWRLDCDYSPWYPSARLFRQERDGDWLAVFRRMAVRLSERLSTIDRLH